MEQSTFNKYFRGEVAAGFAVGACVVSILMFFINRTQPIETSQALIQQQLSQIKNNDLTHIELEITQINQRQDDFQKVQIDQGKQLTQILTIIQEQKK